MSLQDCSDFTVNGDANNTVNGIQYNASVMHFGQKEKERTEYDEFEEVKRGQIFTLERLHTEEEQEWEWELKDGKLFHKPDRLAQRSICTVQVRPDQQTKYTAVIYEGEDAHFFWKRDFERFSRAGLGTPETWQLYGLNRSEIPLLIFHNELVPLANFYKESFWGGVYLWLLTKHLHCEMREIWLNMEGNLCKGLEGPNVPVPLGSFLNIVVPSSAQMLQSDDISFEFLQQYSSSQLDHTILSIAYWHYSWKYIDDLFPEPTDHHLHSCYPRFRFRRLFGLPLDTSDGLRFDTVYSPSRGAVARLPRGEMAWKVSQHCGLVNKTKVGNGLIRFKLDDPQDVEVGLEYGEWGFWEGWLAQSSRSMDAHEMSGMEETCFVVHPLDLCLLASNRKPSLTVENLPPIYLFIYPPPLSISELESWENGLTRTHFWSLDENGRSEMSVEECWRWEVPELQLQVKLAFLESGIVLLQYWPTHIYTALRKWQVARGFDPTTSDWAQSLGYPELEIVGGKKEEARFEGVHDWCSYYRKLCKQAVELQLGTHVQVQATITELPLTTPTPEPSPIPVSNSIPERKRKLTVEDSQVGHNEHSGERPKKRRKKRTLKKPITTPRKVK